MRINTITCHRVYNYGATLQAYALQHYLESWGHEVQIIDYTPWYLRGRYNLFYYNKKAKSRRATLINAFPPIKYILLPYLAFKGGMFKTWGRKEAFDKFENRYYHLTKRRYTCAEELKKAPPIADIYIAGSDQIWNTHMENGKDRAFYLDFGNCNTRRISYAASLATHELEPEWKSFVRDNVARFDVVSVREATGIEILRGLGIKDVSHVLDPVFLLDRQEWANMSQGAKDYGLSECPYLLLYDFLGNDDNMRQFTLDYAKLHHLKIVSINDFRERDYADININDAGPLEFLSLINGAECVVSSSFHATAFSVIFQKEFYTFNLVGHNNSSRMADFLSMLQLSERLNAKHFQNVLDFDRVNITLNEQKESSKRFLFSSMSHAKNSSSTDNFSQKKEWGREKY